MILSFKKSTLLYLMHWPKLHAPFQGIVAWDHYMPEKAFFAKMPVIPPRMIEKISNHASW